MTEPAHPSALRYSVIVPTCRRPETLAVCLARLAPGAQTLPATAYEVIVTDDDPPPGAAAKLGERFPWVRWISGPRRGPAANRNHGARQARGSWLVFTDDDCLPEPGWLAAYAAARGTHPAARVLEGRTFADRPRQSTLETSPVNETGGCLWSCNFAMETALFTAMGGFDERFVWATMEDMDLAERLRERGLDFPFVPPAAVCHPWRPYDAWRAYREHTPSFLLFLELHPDNLKNYRWRTYFRWIAKLFLNHLLRPLATGRWRELPAFCPHALSTCRVIFSVQHLRGKLAKANP